MRALQWYLQLVDGGPQGGEVPLLGGRQGALQRGAQLRLHVCQLRPGCQLRLLSHQQKFRGPSGCEEVPQRYSRSEAQRDSGSEVCGCNALPACVLPLPPISDFRYHTGRQGDLVLGCEHMVVHPDLMNRLMTVQVT